MKIISAPVKFRQHIEKVWRTRPEEKTRFGKIRLDKNERITPFPEKFWQETLAEISQEMVQACPEVWPLYKKLSVFHGLSPEHFLLSAGSDAAIRHCFEVFVAPGDVVFYPEPTFAMVTIYGQLYGAEMNAIQYDSNLQPDIDSMVAAIDKRTSLVILANPNSPVGTYVSNSKVDKILQKAATYRVPVLIDEAYFGFHPYTALELLSEYKNLIVTRSFSKITGMAGLRVGYAIGNPEVISLLTKFRPMYEVNSVGIHFANKILDHWAVAEDYGNRTIEGRNRFVSFLKDCGFPVVNTETNFIHVDFGPLKEEILEILAAKGILVRGMLNIPGYENYTRFSVGPWEGVAPVAEIISAFLAARRIA